MHFQGPSHATQLLHLSPDSEITLLLHHVIQPRYGMME